MDKLRVIVADDSEFMRVAYKRILETQEHLEIVGMAADGEEAVRQAESTKPQVAILDVRMPKLNGIEAAGQILAKQPQTGIVIISAYDDPEYGRLVHMEKLRIWDEALFLLEDGKSVILDWWRLAILRGSAQGKS